MRSVSNKLSQQEASKHGGPCRLGQDDIYRTGSLSLLRASQAALAQTAHGDSSRKRPCLPNHRRHGAACTPTVCELWPQGRGQVWNLKQNWAEPWSSDCQVENPGAFIPRTMQSKQQQTQQTSGTPSCF